jgi:hypothetical protein
LTKVFSFPTSGEGFSTELPPGTVTISSTLLFLWSLIVFISVDYLANSNDSLSAFLLFLVSCDFNMLLAVKSKSGTVGYFLKVDFFYSGK